MAVNSFTSLLDKEILTSPWYISGNILPKGGTLLFGGHSKIGKSFLALNMARNLVLGEQLYDCPFVKCEPCKVLLVEQEIGERGLQKRGSTIFYNTDLEKVKDSFSYLTKESKLLLNTKDGIAILEDAISEFEPNVLILDPIGKMHTYDENSAKDIGELFNTFEHFKKINPKQELAVVLSHHMKKPPQGDYAKDYDALDAHNYRGSVRWFSDPDTIITGKREQGLEKDWESWNIRLRYKLRQEESPDDMIVSFNEEPLEKDVQVGNNLIRYKYSISAEGVRKSPKKKKEKEPVARLQRQNLLEFRK